MQRCSVTENGEEESESSELESPKGYQHFPVDSVNSYASCYNVEWGRITFLSHTLVSGTEFSIISVFIVVSQLNLYVAIRSVFNYLSVLVLCIHDSDYNPQATLR